MRRFRIFSGVVLATLAVAACTRPDRRSALEGGQATFVVKSVEGYAEPGTVSDGAPWKVPTSVELGFSACLRDASSRADINNQDFFVSVPGTNKGYNVRTNEFGCFRWSETLPFNHFAGQSGWVTLKREIVGRGVNSGRRAVEIAVNPWAVGDHSRDSGKAVIPLRDGANGYVPTTLHDSAQANMFLAGDHGSQGASQLLIPEVRIKAFREGEANGFVTLMYIIEMVPKIRSKRANGQWHYSKVEDGDFNIWLQVLAAGVGPQLDQKTLILGGEPFTVGKVVDGKLTAEVHIRQEKQANQGNLELALKVAPRSLSGVAKVRPFNGLYALGKGTVVDDGGGPVYSRCTEENTRACDFATIVQSAKNSGDLEKAGYLRPRKGYVFTNLRLRFLMVQPGETATQRTVAYTASTCITDTQNGTPLANTPMIIRYMKNPSQHAEVERDVIPKETDESGCLNWDGYASHKYYQPEEYFERVVSIEKASGYKEQFTFYVNPWDTNINFGFDSREFTQEKIAEIRGRRKIRSRFFLGGYQYHTVKFQYNIDPFMELEVKKTVLLELVPEVLRYSGIKDARKMTEHLRDGIYLLKVGIQKSYLDPRDNSHLLIRNKDFQAETEMLADRALAKREFVTTNMALVRVVSGLIIVPIELTMRDLRLMRVRSNMVMQLETVDERMVQAFHVFKKYAISAQDLQNQLDKFRKKIELSQALHGKTVGELSPELKAAFDEYAKTLNLPDVSAELSPALKPLADERFKLSLRKDVEVAHAELEQKTKRTRGLVDASLQFLKQRFDDGGPLGTYLNSSGRATEVPHEILRDANITDDFELNPGMLQDLKTALNVNDFSEVSLPTKEDVKDVKFADEKGREVKGLNIFVEQKSGLEPRTFVGPVIFLSNNYSDSVRATDNLDEEACKDPSRPADALTRANEELELNLREKLASMGLKAPGVEDSSAAFQTDADLKGNRQNNAYRYNKFFGSLSHLCFKHVDQLIEEEEKLNVFRRMQLSAMSLQSNFMDYSARVLNVPLEFVSLTDEPLSRLKPGCDSVSPECLEQTKVGTIPVASVGDWANQGLRLATRFANQNPSSVLRRLKGLPWEAKREKWSREDLNALFFSYGPDTRTGLCNVMANKIAHELRSKKLTSVDAWDIHQRIVRYCNSDGGLIHDIKLHINRTGEYKFLGGLNLNFNVGESFSTNWSTSWSAGLELADFVGPIAGTVGAGAGLVLKPASIKYGTSMSESQGTSVSESTYLVSQIAGFRVDLQAYEKCAVVALSPQTVSTMRVDFGDTSWTRWLGLATANFDDPQVDRVFRTGLFVCEGATRHANPVLNVKEMYFYFTQHFTEGDMLDQADLYNHPWLLGMRGMRDFLAFVAKIRAQQVVGLGAFLSGLTGFTPPNQKAWALGHMSRVYQNVLPSFPGYYTILEGDEDIQSFLLEQSGSRLSKVDRDELGEVTRRKLRGDAPLPPLKAAK